MGTMIPEKKESTRNASEKLEEFIRGKPWVAPSVKQAALVSMGAFAFKRLVELGDITESEVDEMVDSSREFSLLTSSVTPLAAKVQDLEERLRDVGKCK